MTTNPSLARALAERDYTEPTPVQRAVLAPEASDRDLLVSAQTGSGKTIAYGLAMGETLLGTAERFAPATVPQALVVAPTRELALQVQREFAWLYAETGARIVSCVGGMDPRQEQRLLNQGAHIVVGTPGRLRDHLTRGRLDISALRVVVLDEADEMLDLGFREDLEFLLLATPPERRSLLFSATVPRGIVALAKRYQRDALRIEVASAEGGHADIEYRAMRVVPTEVEHAVVNVLRYYDTPSAIVFCNTREAVRRLHAMLQERQFSAVALSGELSQSERNHALQALRDGRARVCVATDVAARGIDLPNLGLVIHAELPNDAESLQHRSGRTGRAGRKGVSVLLVPPSRRRRTEDLVRGLGITPSWSGPPTPEDIRSLDHERMLRDALITEEPSEEDAGAGRALLAAHSPEHLAAALVRLYRSRLPAPEEVADPGVTRSARDRVADRDFGGGAAAGSAWFSLNVGRSKNADPKWLLPLICRRGNVTRQEIGAIRIFEDETAFEVSLAAAERFGEAVRKVEGDVVIEPLPGGPPQDRPARIKPVRRKPYHDKPHRDAPHRDASHRDASSWVVPLRDAPPRGEQSRDEQPYEKPFRGKKFRAGPGPSADGGAERGRPAFETPREAKPAGRGESERSPKSRRPSGFEGKPKGKRPRPS